jgi:hypothetical protein
MDRKTFRAGNVWVVSGDDGVVVRVDPGVGARLGGDDVLRLYAWLGEVLGSPEVVR